MSAFVCGMSHINALVTWGNRYGLADDPEAIGQLCHDENMRAVNFRYDEENRPDFFTWEPANAKNLAPVEVIKAAKCLQYQMVEPEDYAEKPGYTWLDSLIAEAIHQLPGYDEAEWEIPDKEPVEV